MKKEKNKLEEEIIEQEIEEFEEAEQANKEIEELQEKNLILEEKIKLLQADSINYRKRKDEEVRNKLKYANEDLIVELLNIQNTFQKALNAKIEDEKIIKYMTGFQMISNQIDKMLEDFGVKKIDLINKEYDYSTSEAVMIEKDPNKDNNIVTEVYRDAYMLYDKIILVGQVKVNKIEEE